MGLLDVIKYLSQGSPISDSPLAKEFEKNPVDFTDLTVGVLRKDASEPPIEKLQYVKAEQLEERDQPEKTFPAIVLAKSVSNWSDFVNADYVFAVSSGFVMTKLI